MVSFTIAVGLAGCSLIVGDGNTYAESDAGHEGDAGRRVDSGIDGGSVDSGSDAGRCSTECIAPTPACLAAEDRCVECVDSVNCTEPLTPHCAPDNECVECTAHAHCDDGEPCTSDRCELD